MKVTYRNFMSVVTASVALVTSLLALAGHLFDVSLAVGIIIGINALLLIMLGAIQVIIENPTSINNNGRANLIWGLTIVFSSTIVGFLTGELPPAAPPQAVVLNDQVLELFLVACATSWLTLNIADFSRTYFIYERYLFHKEEAEAPAYWPDLADPDLSEILAKMLKNRVVESISSWFVGTVLVFLVYVILQILLTF